MQQSGLHEALGLLRGIERCFNSRTGLWHPPELEAGALPFPQHGKCPYLLTCHLILWMESMSVAPSQSGLFHPGNVESSHITYRCVRVSSFLIGQGMLFN